MKRGIKTVSGKHLDVFAIRDEDIDILDIAHSLAQVNRFGGHVTFPISVAQHSVFVSYMSEVMAAEEYPMQSQMRARFVVSLQGLLHDASEAYLGDVTKWLKEDPAFDRYREVEDELQQRIFRKYGVPAEQSPIVTHMDRRVCTWEAENGGMTFDFSSPGYEPITAKESHQLSILDWHQMEWREARQEFMKRFEFLLNMIGAYR